MAFQVEKIHPLDLQPRKAVGVSIPFSAKDVFTSTYSTQEAIKSNLINFFLTGKKERFFNPNFGTGLRALLFDQATVDLEETLSYEVRKGLVEWFPNVEVKTLQVVNSQDIHTVTLYLEYSIVQTNIQDELVINFVQ